MMNPVLLTLLLLFGVTGIVLASDLEDGLTAYGKGNYATALSKFKKAAEAGNTSAQFNLA